MSSGTSDRSIRPHSADLAGIILLAFGTLVFELTCNKVVVAQNYGHLGYIVIGIALLGFAASGVLLACHQGIRRVESERLVPLAATAAAISMLLAYRSKKVCPSCLHPPPARARAAATPGAPHRLRAPGG
jgi:hypothetical protein